MIDSLHGKSYLAGVLFDEDGRPFRAVSPLDGQPLEPEYRECSPGAAAQALEQADAAFQSFRKTSSAQRADFLERIADELRALGDALLERARLETGLPLVRLAAERERTMHQLQMFAALLREGSWVDARIDRAEPERQPTPKPDLRRMLRPLGPVIVFGASNFPLAYSVAGGDTASALAAGCPVVVKAHEAHPGTSELTARAVVKAAEACDLPPGVFSMLHGSGPGLGLALVTHPLAKAAGFTGSRKAGRALFDAAVARPEPIPVFAEMSSVNPVFILPGAMRECANQIAEGLCASITGGMGQFCTKPGLVFGLGGPAMENFAGELGAAMRRVAPGTMLHSGIHRSYFAGLARRDKLPGVVALAISDEDPDPARSQGQAVLYATDSEDFLRKPELQEEIFGPTSLLVTAPGIADLLTIAQELDGQLTASIHGTTEDLAAAADLIAILERKAGRLIFNGFPTGLEVCAATHHGGPYPATTDERYTSMGTAAIARWLRPVCYQDWPHDFLPPELQNENPLSILRTVNGASQIREAL